MSLEGAVTGAVPGAAAPVPGAAAPVPGAGDFFKKGSKLVAVFDVDDGNTAKIQAAGFAPAGTTPDKINLKDVTFGKDAGDIATNLLKDEGKSGRDIAVKFGGKPKRKSSKNRRKSKGGRKPKRKSSKNRK